MPSRRSVHQSNRRCRRRSHPPDFPEDPPGFATRGSRPSVDWARQIFVRGAPGPRTDGGQSSPAGRTVDGRQHRALVRRSGGWAYRRGGETRRHLGSDYAILPSDRSTRLPWARTAITPGCLATWTKARMRAPGRPRSWAPYPLMIVPTGTRDAGGDLTTRLRELPAVVCAADNFLNQERGPRHARLTFT